MITILTNQRKALPLLGLLAVFTLPARAQNPLEGYVQTALNNNLVLQQKNISFEKAVYSLKTANSLFVPTIAFQAGYQHGDGGRSINFPVGDLLNPVYATLNQLTASHSFPQIDNVHVNFFPNNFYDLHVRTSVPIVNADLFYNKQIQEGQVELQQFEVDAYKRELIKNVRIAYFNYLSATKAVHIFESALKLATEGKRINESLITNGKGIYAYVIRSESEIQQVNASIVAAQKQAENARLYFNFLLNAEPSTPVDTTYDLTAAMSAVDQALLREIEVNQREELQELNRATQVQQTVYNMNNHYWLPKLNGFVDLGSQASNFKFNSQSRYYFVGLQLDVPIFAGGKNRFKTLQAGLDLKNLQLTTDNTKRQLNMAASVAKNNLLRTYENYLSSVKQAQAAGTYYELIEKGYKAGTNTFIEMIDARNQYTQAGLQRVIYQYQLLSDMAAFERELSIENNK
jgi:outer membrane protein TolC